MDACIVIPARFASSRYPGKPLVPLRGASGQTRSLLARCVDVARAVDLGAGEGGAAQVFVATDDARIADEGARIGVDVIMTPDTCANGSERVAEAVARAGIEADIIVNLQGDAPLTPPHFLSDLIAAMRADPECGMATPCLRCDPETVGHLLADRRAGRVGATTVVRDGRGYALYFSKEVLPFGGGRADVADAAPIFHHVGVYAYRRAALRAYADWAPGPLERSEGLEQLRFLENGQPVRVVEVSAPGAAFWEVNNPSDVPLVEAYLARQRID